MQFKRDPLTQSKSKTQLKRSLHCKFKCISIAIDRTQHGLFMFSCYFQHYFINFMTEKDVKSCLSAKNWFQPVKSLRRPFTGRNTQQKVCVVFWTFLTIPRVPTSSFYPNLYFSKSGLNIKLLLKGVAWPFHATPL